MGGCTRARHFVYAMALQRQPCKDSRTSAAVPSIFQAFVAAAKRARRSVCLRELPYPCVDTQPWLTVQGWSSVVPFRRGTHQIGPSSGGLGPKSSDKADDPHLEMGK